MSGLGKQSLTVLIQIRLAIIIIPHIVSNIGLNTSENRNRSIKEEGLNNKSPFFNIAISYNIIDITDATPYKYM